MYVVEIQITGKIYFQDCCLQNADGLTAVHDAQSEQKQEGEQYGGEKGYASQAGNLRLMDLARVRLVEEVLAEGDKQNLRNNDACEQCDEKQDSNVD